MREHSDLEVNVFLILGLFCKFEKFVVNLRICANLETVVDSAILVHYLKKMAHYKCFFYVETLVIFPFVILVTFLVNLAMFSKFW